MVKMPEWWIEINLKKLVGFIVDNRWKNPDYYVEKGGKFIIFTRLKDFWW